MTGFILSPYHSKELSNYWELAWKLYHILGPGTNKKSSIVRNVTYFQKYRVIYLYVSRLKSYDFNFFKRQFQSRHSVKHFNGFLLPLVWNVSSLAWNSRSFTMGPLLMSPASCQAFASCRFFYPSMWLYHSPHPGAWPSILRSESPLHLKARVSKAEPVLHPYVHPFCTVPDAALTKYSRKGKRKGVGGRERSVEEESDSAPSGGANTFDIWHWLEVTQLTFLFQVTRNSQINAQWNWTELARRSLQC